MTNNDSKYKIIDKKDYQKYSLLSPFNEINQIPSQLYFYGNNNLLNKKNTKILCIIGSRKMTNYGKQAVDYLVSGLQNYNIIIISGLALGIDSEAHKAAIRYNIPTITFPGSGLDEEVLYPKTNIDLFENIIKENGAAISEYKPKEKSQMYFFPARNRLMAALSDLILVIEAEEKSGTQITARLALEYNKDVAIVPGSIFSAYSRGTAQLFKDGAYPVTSSEDIIDLLKLNDNKNIFEDLNNSNNKDLSNNTKQTHPLSEKEEAILNILKSPIHKDDLLDNQLLKSKNLSSIDILITLTELESKGFIKDNYGEIIRVK